MGNNDGFLLKENGEILLFQFNE